MATPSNLSRAVEAAALLGLAACALPLVGYAELPDRLPGHFGLSGRPDAWGDHSLLLFLPGLALFQYALLTVVALGVGAAAEGPTRLARRMVAMIKAQVVWLIAFLEWRIPQVARGEAEGLGRGFTPILVAALAATVAWHVLAIHRGRGREPGPQEEG